MTTSVTTVVFDVNETLSDLSAMRGRFTDVGAPADLAAVWFASVLRDGFALSTCGHQAPFADIARGVLASSLPTASLDRPVSDAIDHVMEGFMSLEVHPDVAAGIEALSDAGLRLVTLSNGSAGVADALLTQAGLRDHFEALLTVEDAGVWKPAQAAYEFAAHQCGEELSRMVLVAVHPWDLHGARAAGMQTAWINRTGSPYPDHFSRPDLEVSGLADLPAAMGARKIARGRPEPNATV
ncbi:MAG: haloacid dehalogenase type II [Ornithinimicrobium sp.]